MRKKTVKEWLAQLDRTANLKRRLGIKTIRKENVDGLICEQAYRLFEQRGGIHGSDMDDWLEAERIVMKRPGR